MHRMKDRERRKEFRVTDLATGTALVFHLELIISHPSRRNSDLVSLRSLFLLLPSLHPSI
jgi:hypothetical protein